MSYICKDICVRFHHGGRNAYIRQRCICTHAHTSTHMHTHIIQGTHINALHVHMHICAHTPHTYEHICTHITQRVHTCTHTSHNTRCKDMQIHNYMTHTHICTHVHTCTHVHIHIQANTFPTTSSQNCPICKMYPKYKGKHSVNHRFPFIGFRTLFQPPGALTNLRQAQLSVQKLISKLRIRTLKLARSVSSLQKTGETLLNVKT